MPVLLLRLAGPLQSWGLQSRFSHRDTAREPTKSGVVGLLGAALGMARENEELVARLAAWPLGVRVDREGQPLRDFHTVGGGRVAGRPYGVATARGTRAGTVLSERDYLADADFLVGLQAPADGLLARVVAALEDPVWPLYLGRRSCPPAVPPLVGVQPGELREVLTAWPWRPRRRSEDEAGLRLVLECDPWQGELRHDCPVSFRPEARQYRPRWVETSFVPVVAGAGA